ncbi:hypothetical protein FOL47_004630 [Perkinsus chesapeaki]|uniref:Uncharacterized protein n=1 Tax=Perkinsus chesapeaki TaxID=330153 RepID=A0A7J6M1F0_PERCH|nr:hypothetical protein FOL47_004630 [Perkinsus chesapeaki]
MSSSSSSLNGRCGGSTGHLYGTPTVAHLLSNEDVHRLHARIGELTMENEALRRHVEGCHCGGGGEVPGRLDRDMSLSTVSSAQLILALAESVRSGVPPLVEAGETGEAIAVLWGAVKEKIRQAHELGYRSVRTMPMMALSPLPAAIADRRSAHRPLSTVMERDEEERQAELRDDLSEDIVRLKDIREG